MPNRVVLYKNREDLRCFISEGYCTSHLEGIRLWSAGLIEVSGAACLLDALLSVPSLCLIQRATFKFCMF